MATVPDHLHTITVVLSAGDVTISWDTRQALIARLQHIRDSSSLRSMFEAVGATRPVELNAAQRATLLGLLDNGRSTTNPKRCRPNSTTSGARSATIWQTSPS